MAFKTEVNQKKENFGRIETVQATGREQSDKVVNLEKPERPLQQINKTTLFDRFFLTDSRRILIADAKNSVRDFLADQLCKMGHEPVGARSWIEALKRFTTGDFDLVFTDSKIIGWDSFSLAFHIKAISSETPVVMLVDNSSRNFPDNQEGCCIDYLLFKPFGPKDIQCAVRKCYLAGPKFKAIDFYCKSSAL